MATDQGKFDKAVNNLKRIAKFNGREVEDSVFDEFIKHYREKLKSVEIKSSDTFMGMLRTPRLRKFTIILLIKSYVFHICSNSFFKLIIHITFSE